MARALLIVARNLGDAAITVDFLRTAAEDNSGIQWHIWCRPSVDFLFSRLPNVIGVSCSNFPVGSSKQFDIVALKQLLGNLVELRREKFNFSLDLIGDFREVLLGRLCGSMVHLSPRWPSEHPFRKIIRPAPAWLLREGLPVTGNNRSVYAAYASLSRYLALSYGQLGPNFGSSFSNDALSTSAGGDRSGSKRVIGIHPFASMDCKQWNDDKWRGLMSALVSKGNRLMAFGAPQERNALLKLTKGILNEDEVITLPVAEFFEKIKELDLLVGLDSFSIHAAHLEGISSVMINGSNDSVLFVPTTSLRVASIADCGYQPCMNIPRCRGTEKQFSCNQGVSIATVLEAIGKV